MSEHRFEILKNKIEQWAKDRKIIPNAKAETQLLKGVSEMGELADAFIKGQPAAINDAIGDVLVCLVNFCALENIDIVECLEGSYNEIKDRKGTLRPNGTFVKDGDK